MKKTSGIYATIPVRYGHRLDFHPKPLWFRSKAIHFFNKIKSWQIDFCTIIGKWPPRLFSQKNCLSIQFVHFYSSFWLSMKSQTCPPTLIYHCAVLRLFGSSQKFARPFSPSPLLVSMHMSPLFYPIMISTHFWRNQNIHVRMAERSKALRSGRSPVFWARVRIPLLTVNIAVK